MGNEGIFLGPADGKDFTNPIGGAMVLKIRDEYTDGAYSVHDNTIPPGSPGPRPHLHRRHDEAFYVLQGSSPSGWARERSWPRRVPSWWCRAAWSTSPRTPGRSRPGCC